MKTPQIHPVRPSNAPLLSYQEALSRFLRTEQGEITTVDACSAQVFARFIQTCLGTRPKKTAARHACMEEFEGLNYRDPLSRWYAIELLLSYRFPVALFTSAEEAA